MIPRIKYFGRWFPLFWFGARAVTVRPFIFILNESWDGDEDLTLLKIHESVHLNQQKEAFWAWLFRYAFSPSFRLLQEVEAYREQYKAESIIYGSVDNAGYARMLSSWTYLKMISYDNAMKEIASWEAKDKR